MVNRSKLEELVKLGLSTRQIAVELGKGQTTVRYWLEKHNIFVVPSKGGRKKVLPERTCLNCNNLLKSRASKSKYCNLGCAAQYQQKAYIDQWLNGEVTGQISGGTLISGHIRSCLLSQANYRCSECGWSKVNPFTNKIPLEINHIDGNFLNNSSSNLEVLCPNCHALKHTYQNRGTGRRAKGYIN